MRSKCQQWRYDLHHLSKHKQQHSARQHLQHIQYFVGIWDTLNHHFRKWDFEFVQHFYHAGKHEQYDELQPKRNFDDELRRGSSLPDAFSVSKRQRIPKVIAVMDFNFRRRE